MSTASASTTARGTLRTVAIAAVAALSLVLVATPASAKKVGKATVPDTMTVGETELALRGAGLRTRAMFKLYAASFYTNVEGDANAVLEADEPMAIHLYILSKLASRKKMVEALTKGFKASTGGNTAPIQAQIDSMMANMDQPIKPGVEYTLEYEPGVGTTM